MNISLLSVSPALSHWIGQTWPEVKVFSQVEPELLESDVFIFLPFYVVDDRYYHILNLWRKYLAIHKRNSKQLLLDWIPDPSANHLYITSLTGNPQQWIQKAQYVKENPSFGVMADPDILPAIEYRLMSHGKNAFYVALISMKRALLKVESCLNQGKHLPDILNRDEGLHLIREYDRTNNIWERAEPYFQLMPHFPLLNQYLQIREKLSQLIDEKIIPRQKLSVFLSDYLENAVTLVTDFYEMEKPKK